MATTQAHDKLSFPVRLNEMYQDSKLTAKAAKLREDGNSWDDIAEQLGVNRGQASLLARVHELGLISFRNENEFKTKLVKARDKEEQAWAVIGARLGGMTEGRIENLYTEYSGVDFTESDIGRGGRPRSDGSAKPKKAAKKAAKKTAKKPAAKKAPAKGKKAAAKKATSKKGKAPNFGDEPTQASVAKALEGKTATVKKGNTTVDLEITEVQAVKQSKKSGKWGVKVTTSEGAERTFPLDSVQSVK